MPATRCIYKYQTQKLALNTFNLTAETVILIQSPNKIQNLVFVLLYAEVINFRQPFSVNHFKNVSLMTSVNPL